MRYWSAGGNLKGFGGLDSFMTHLKGCFNPPFDFHMEYIKPLHRKSKTTSKWLMYGFIL